MGTKEKIELIDKVLRILDSAAVLGLRNCGKLYQAGCELERLRFNLEREEAEERALDDPAEEEEEG